MKWIMRLLTVGLIALAFYAGYWMGSPRGPETPEEVEVAFNKFCKIANTVKAYVATHDGELPGDLYQAMVDPNALTKEFIEEARAYTGSGSKGAWPESLWKAYDEPNVITSFHDLVFQTKQVPFYFLHETPVKLNKDLSKNTKAPLFWLVYEGIGEIWTFYTDGTVERKRTPATRGGIPFEWYSKFHKTAGFPYWGVPEMKDEWIRQNRDKLVWDDKEGMYVVKRPPQTQQTTAPADPG